MNIIDHVYIGILPLRLYTVILGKLTTFAQHQLTPYHNHIPPNSYIKPLSLITVYHNKVEYELLPNQSILAIDIPKDVKYYKIYTQAWTNVTLTLLQCPKNIKIIINALIYNHTLYCLSTRDILSPDKPIKPSYH